MIPSRKKALKKKRKKKKTEVNVEKSDYDSGKLMFEISSSKLMDQKVLLNLVNCPILVKMMF